MTETDEKKRERFICSRPILRTMGQLYIMPGRIIIFINEVSYRTIMVHLHFWRSDANVRPQTGTHLQNSLAVCTTSKAQ